MCWEKCSRSISKTQCIRALDGCQNHISGAKAILYRVAYHLECQRTSLLRMRTGWCHADGKLQVMRQKTDTPAIRISRWRNHWWDMGVNEKIQRLSGKDQASISIISPQTPVQGGDIKFDVSHIKLVVRIALVGNWLWNLRRIDVTFCN